MAAPHVAGDHRCDVGADDHLAGHGDEAGYRPRTHTPTASARVPRQELPRRRVVVGSPQILEPCCGVNNRSHRLPVTTMAAKPNAGEDFPAMRARRKRPPRRPGRERVFPATGGRPAVVAVGGGAHKWRSPAADSGERRNRLTVKGGAGRAGGAGLAGR